MQVAKTETLPSRHTAALKERLRQQEVRLAALNQAKQAVEARMAGMQPWVASIFLLAMGALLARPQEADMARMVAAKPGLIGFTFFAFLAVLLSLSGPLEGWFPKRRWQYPGSEPGFLLTDDEDGMLAATAARYSRAIEENQRMLRKLELASAFPVLMLLAGVLTFLVLIGLVGPPN